LILFISFEIENIYSQIEWLMGHHQEAAPSTPSGGVVAPFLLY